MLGQENIWRTATVEICRATGGHTQYGALGGALVLGSPGFKIIAPDLVTSIDRSHTIAPKDENISCFLAEDFKRGATRGITEGFQLRNGGLEGRLFVCEAVIGDVGSSEWLFYVLGRVLVGVLSMDNATEPDLSLFTREAIAQLSREAVDAVRRGLPGQP